MKRELPLKNKAGKGWETIWPLILLLVLGGCGGEPPKPTKVPMPPVQRATLPSPPPSVPEPPPPPKKPEIPPPTRAYNPKGKPDPFKPLIVEKPDLALKKVQKPEATGATPLERIDLDQLKLVAIVWNIPEPRAMVEDSTGKGYILTKGTALGRNRGKVLRIAPEGVVIRERDETSGRDRKPRDIILKLYPD